MWEGSINKDFLSFFVSLFFDFFFLYDFLFVLFCLHICFETVTGYLSYFQSDDLYFIGYSWQEWVLMKVKILEDFVSCDLSLFTFERV